MRPSGCRSEDLMQKNLFLFLGLFVAFSTTSTAQTANNQKPVAMRVATGGSLLEAESRPRRVEEKASGVRSSVVANTAQVERSAFALLNQKRAERGLKPLVWNDKVAAIARLHSRNMAEFEFFNHRGLDGKLVSDRADKGGLVGWGAIGENIAFNRGFDDPVLKAVNLWLSSTTHYQNLMDATWQDSAVGVAIAADGSYYFTQVFLRK